MKHPQNSAALAVVLFVGADAWMLAGAPGPYALIWLLIVCSGICMVSASLKSGPAGAVLLCIAVAHVAALLMLVPTDDRTFYGGAMVPVIAGYCWALVSLGLFGVVGVRLAQSRKRRQAKRVPREAGHR